MFASWQQRSEPSVAYEFLRRETPRLSWYVAFEVQVANHELLGHGSGKLLMEREDGSFNFDRSLINPLTGKPVESWYKPGERPGSRLGEINGSMEECRAEAVAVFRAYILTRVTDPLLLILSYRQSAQILTSSRSLDIPTLRTSALCES